MLEPDRGLAVTQVRLPPRSSCALGCVKGSTGQFVFVFGRSGHRERRMLAPWESIFSSSDGGELAVTAAGIGAEVIALSMPLTEPEYAGGSKQ